MGEFEDPKKTDDQIAKQLAADLATEFEVYKKVKEQLEEKGATAKEIKESTENEYGQSNIRDRLDDAKNEEPKKADNKIVEEVVAKIVSVFQVYKKVKEQLKEKGATTEERKKF